MREPHRPEFGPVLRRLRTGAGLTQEELAERAGLSVRAVSDLERGVNRNPQHKTAQLLLRALAPEARDRAELEVAVAGRRGPRSAPAPGPGADLPAPLDGLVGREREVAALRQLLSDSRLVTLTGAGGVGKTRLAVAAAAGLANTFPDGVRFVSLAPVSDPRLVLSTIARSLAARESHGRSAADALAEAVGQRRILLVLDNFEHLLPAAADIAALLARCPGLVTLVTSRAPLGVRGERAFPLAPLPEAEAARLLLERARATEPGFARDPADAPIVAELCRRLDGLPLAIELTARRARLFGPRALLARLDRRLSLLTDGPRDVPDRQRTLRATLDWSYDMLAEGERTVLRSMGVFAGEMALAAIEGVCDSEGTSGRVLEAVATLRDQSLVGRVEGPDGESRFSLLETVREYALELLEAHGESETVRWRHASYFLRLAEELDGRIRAEPARKAHWLGLLEAEVDNLRAALGWLSGQGRAEDALRLASATAGLWFGSYRWAEGRRWLDRALALPGAIAAPRARAEALLAAGTLADHQGDFGEAQARYEASASCWRALGDRRGLARALFHLPVRGHGTTAEARAAAEEALALWRELGDATGISDSLHRLAFFAMYDGDYDRSHDYLRESRHLRVRLGAPEAVAWTDFLLAQLALFRGDLEEASAGFERVLARFRALGHKNGVAGTLPRLAELADRAGDHERAESLAAEGLVLARELGERDYEAWLLRDLGRIVRHRGDERRATALFRESLMLRQLQGHTVGIAVCLCELAEGALATGHQEGAVRLFAAAEAIRADAGIVPLTTDFSGFGPAGAARHVAALRAALGERAFEAAWASGKAMTTEDAIATALEDEAGSSSLVVQRGAENRGGTAVPEGRPCACAAPRHEMPAPIAPA